MIHHTDAEIKRREEVDEALNWALGDGIITDDEAWYNCFVMLVRLAAEVRRLQSELDSLQNSYEKQCKMMSVKFDEIRDLMCECGKSYYNHFGHDKRCGSDWDSPTFQLKESKK